MGVDDVGGFGPLPCGIHHRTSIPMSIPCCNRQPMGILRGRSLGGRGPSLER